MIGNSAVSDAARTAKSERAAVTTRALTGAREAGDPSSGLHEAGYRNGGNISRLAISMVMVKFCAPKKS
jgi:hypothetical protein